jgi:hypothetical protein
VLILQKKPVVGFFIEGFGLINSEVETYSFNDGQNYNQRDKRLTAVALGFVLKFWSWF